MHGVAQSLREIGATAGRRSALALCRGEAGAVDVDVKEQTVAFKGSSATLRSAKWCLPLERKYFEIVILAIEHNSCLRCGVATALLGSMFSASDTGLGDDHQSWAVNGLSQKAIHNAKQRTASAPHGKEVTSLASRATSSRCRCSSYSTGALRCPMVASSSSTPASWARDSLPLSRGMVCFNLGGRGSICDTVCRFCGL